MKFSKKLLVSAAKIVRRCAKKKWKIATAESCTGGLIAACITEIPGASKGFQQGYITYSDASKNKILNVSINSIRKFGAVSKEVAILMAKGLYSKNKCDLSISVTGIAGPSGGRRDKPVGLTYIALKSKKINFCGKFLFSGDRRKIRLAALEKTILMISKLMSGKVSSNF